MTGVFNEQVCPHMNNGTLYYEPLMHNIDLGSLYPDSLKIVIIILLKGSLLITYCKVIG